MVMRLTYGLTGLPAARRTRPKESRPGGTSYRPQSNPSASPLAAGEAGFLTLIQSRVRLERQGEPLRFELMAPTPRAQAWRKTNRAIARLKVGPCRGYRRRNMKRVRWIKAPTRPASEIGDDDDWMVGQGDKS